ncbi:MAG: ATP-binding protein, partial [Patescibacteria group bacterium]
VTAIETTILLGVIYGFLSITIGWLKQTIDTLLGREKELRNIAEEGEVRLTTILQQLPVGVMIVDAKDHKLTGNKHLEKVTGRKIKGRMRTDESYPSKYIYHNDKPVLQKDWPIARALTKGKTVTLQEMEYRREDKKRLFLRVNASPIKKDEEIIAAVSTFYDVTHEKELEQRKDDFVNMASHELKTPITSMKLYIDLLLKRVQHYEDQRALKAVRSIKLQTEKLQELVSDLLDVSRLQTGKLQFTKEPFSLTELLEETIEMLQETTKDHEIILQQAKDLTVIGDRFRIYQVVSNLVTNAIKYSSSGKEIIVRVEKEGEKAIVHIQDNGIGIPKEQRRKIFERLYQVTDPKEKTFPGIGMGLYIAKEIIKRHKGRIWVESEKGKGSKFSFTLPLKK